MCIDITKEILENINIDIDKEILKNIDIRKILYRLEFGISNTPTQPAWAKFNNFFNWLNHILCTRKNKLKRDGRKNVPRQVWTQLMSAIPPMMRPDQIWQELKRKPDHHIGKWSCPNCQVYLSKLSNVFVQIIKCICPNHQM